MNYCSNCGNVINKDAKFCSSCGTATSKKTKEHFCPKCGSTYSLTDKFCPGCGTPTPPQEIKQPQIDSLEKQEPEKKGEFTKEGRKIIDSGPRPEQHQSAPVPPPISKPPKKKKRGCLGCLGKSILIILVLMIVGVVIIWNLPDDEEEELTGTNIPGIVDIKPTKKEGAKKYSKPNLKAKSTLIKTTVDTDTAEMIIEATNEISIVLPIALLDNKEELVVKELKPVQLPNGQKSDLVLDISLGNQHQFDDFIEILVTPPASFNPQNDYIQCLSMSAGDNNWQPVMAFYEPEINKVRVVTDHLSSFAINVIKYNGTALIIDPMYTVATETYKYFRTITSSDAVSILDGYNTERVSKTLNKDYHVLSWNTVMDVYGLAGTGLSFMENGAGMSGLSKINEAAGNIGIGLSVIQIALDAYNGKVQEAQVGVYKTFLNTIVSKGFNTRAMNLALIGVFAIDYSLTTFANEAWAGREALYETIWDNYQRRQRKNKINLRWWKKEIIVGMKKANDPSKYESVVEGIIAKYINDFWDDETEIAIIQSEVGPIFSAGGGLNKKMKEKLSTDFRLQILQYLQALLHQLQKKYIYQARKELSMQRIALANDLNREHLIQCQVDLNKNEKPDKYNQLKVVFEVAGNEMKKMWQGLLNKDAKMDFYCTAAGYIGGGMPTEATLYIPDKMENENFEKIKAKVSLKQEGKVTQVLFKKVLKKIIYADLEINFTGTFESKSRIEGSHKYKHDGYWDISIPFENGLITNNTISVAAGENKFDLVFTDIKNPINLTGISYKEKREDNSEISLSGNDIPFKYKNENGVLIFTYKGDISKYITRLAYYDELGDAKETLLNFDRRGEIKISIELSE